MWYIIVILSVICVAFSIWVRAYYKKQEKSNLGAKDRSAFRTEDVLEEYSKPMKDKEQTAVDFEDAD